MEKDKTHNSELDIAHHGEHLHPYAHTHLNGEGEHHHGHHHSHQHTKAVLNRMARAIGHLQSVKRMVEQGRDCDEVLIQLSAVNAAINRISKIILKDHIDNCIVDAAINNDQKTIENLKDAIDKLIK